MQGKRDRLREYHMARDAPPQALRELFRACGGGRRSAESLTRDRRLEKNETRIAKYLNRAEELRVIAETMKDAQARAAVLLTAESYERLATRMMDGLGIA
jgi:hypothetical protein